MSESRSDSDSKKVSYQRVLKPWKSCKERLELNENNTTSTIGAKRNRKKTPMKSLRKRGLSNPFGGLPRARPASAATVAGVGAGGRDSIVLTPWPPWSRARRPAGRAA